MKNIVLLLGIIFLSFASYAQEISFRISIPDTIRRYEYNDSITITIDNNSETSIEIKDPQYWGNIIPQILHNDKNISLIRVNPWSKNLEQKILINARSTYQTKFQYRLSELSDFSILPNGRYCVFFILYDNKIDIKSNKHYFYIQ